MKNPFEGANPNPNVVVFDTASGKTNLAGHAFQKWILAEMEKQGTATMEVVADFLAPLTQRIETLEMALEAERQRTSEAIAAVVGDFFDTDDDDAPDMATLKRMATQHQKQMEGLNNA